MCVKSAVPHAGKLCFTVLLLQSSFCIDNLARQGFTGLQHNNGDVRRLKLSKPVHPTCGQNPLPVTLHANA